MHVFDVKYDFWKSISYIKLEFNINHPILLDNKQIISFYTAVDGL